MKVHQFDFDIEIPKELITKEKSNHIKYELLENKIILGLVGYGKSGKDFVANKFVNNYKFHRVAFADNIKIEMNKYFKEVVYNYLNTHSSQKNEIHPEIKNGIFLDDGRTLTLDMIDFLTEDKSIKRKLRPFIIWYGEKIREINGKSYWINKAFKVDASGYDKIILSDVRRVEELNIFKNSNSHIKRTNELFALAGCSDKTPKIKTKLFSSLLFHVNQFELTDTDILTNECIKVANEQWLFDDIVYIDSRLPEKGKYRENALSSQIIYIANKYGIKTPDKSISTRQIKMFQD